jgi:hypothetical protein
MANLFIPSNLSSSGKTMLKYMNFHFIILYDNIASSLLQLINELNVTPTVTILDNRIEEDREQILTLLNKAELILGFHGLQRLEPDARKDRLADAFEKFYEIAGVFPKGVFMFQPDTFSLNWLSDNYGIEYCVGYCFDQWKLDGMSMRGGFQAPYYASRENALVPSKNQGVVIFPWFTWDWIERFIRSHNINVHPVDNYYYFNSDAERFSFVNHLIKNTLDNLQPFGYVQIGIEYLWNLSEAYTREYLLNIVNNFRDTCNFLTLKEICETFKNDFPTNPEYHIDFTSWFGNSIQWTWGINSRTAKRNGEIVSLIDYDKQTPDPYLTKLAEEWETIDTSLNFEIDKLCGGEFNPPCEKKSSPSFVEGLFATCVALMGIYALLRRGRKKK